MYVSKVWEESVCYMEPNSGIVPVKPFRVISNNKIIQIMIMCKCDGYLLVLINTRNHVNILSSPE